MLTNMLSKRPENNDWVIDIYREESYFNPTTSSHLLANIQLHHTFFQLSLKNGFAVLEHRLMKERLFLQTMNIIDIIYEFFGNIIIKCDNDAIHVPVLQKPFCNIKIS